MLRCTQTGVKAGKASTKVKGDVLCEASFDIGGVGAGLDDAKVLGNAPRLHWATRGRAGHKGHVVGLHYGLGVEGSNARIGVGGGDCAMTWAIPLALEIASTTAPLGIWRRRQLGRVRLQCRWSWGWPRQLGAGLGLGNARQNGSTGGAQLDGSVILYEFLSGTNLRDKAPRRRGVQLSGAKCLFGPLRDDGRRPSILGSNAWWSIRQS
ncbi:unnamed protein product [Ilex paraguariensis]|uniref:Uncharacterized protein n=1 Tax=Ilex paraguariensis TaxID=185542 RepID=A0ABC8U8T9_9AQUA